MKDGFLWFWTAMIFGSIAWYFFLLFYVGIKGGFEIVRMTRSLTTKAGAQGEDEQA
jgi:hypothetical protein